MRFLGIIEDLEQCTLIKYRAGIANIWNAKPDGTDFFDKVRTVLVTPADPAINPVTTLPSTVPATKSRNYAVGQRSF